MSSCRNSANAPHAASTSVTESCSTPCRRRICANRRRWSAWDVTHSACPDGPGGCRPVWEDFLYVYQGGPQWAARAAARARAVAPLALRLRPRNTPGGWRGQRVARWAAADGTGVGVVEVLRRQPAAPRLSDAAQGRARRVRVAGRGRRGRGWRRECAGRPSKLKGASRRKRRPCGPPLTSEPLRPSRAESPVGRPMACP